jgi:RNA polymerase sigma-70 factor (ECF subfamily)
MSSEIHKSKEGDPYVSKSGAAASGDGGSRWEELVRGCARGDHAALSSLYDQTSSLVYGVALRVLSNPEDAEEVTIDVYSQVWRTAAQFEAARGSVMAWLVMLARSRAIDRTRSRATRMRVEAPIADTACFAAQDAGPDRVTEAGQRRSRVRAAMDRLSADQRRVVELAFFSGLSHSELADHLGVPLGTVKTRIRASMVKLRESLGEYAQWLPERKGQGTFRTT